MAADKKISQLPTAGALSGTELLAIVQSSITVETDINTLLAFVLTGVVSGAAANTQVAVFSGTATISGDGTLVHPSGLLGLVDSINGQIAIVAQNNSAGTAAFSKLQASNGTDLLNIKQYGTAFTTAGLLQAGLSSIESNSTVGLLHNIGSGGKYWWCINSTTAATMTLTSNVFALISAKLQLAAGTTTVQPLLFASGTNLTTAVAGSVEYNGTNFFATRVGTTREGLLTGIQSALNVLGLTAITQLVNQIKINIGGVDYYVPAGAANTALT